MLLSGRAATRRRYSTFNYRLLSLNFIALETKGVAGDCHKTVHFLKTTQFDNVYWPSPPLVSLTWCRVLYSSRAWLHLDGIRTAVITFFYSTIVCEGPFYKNRGSELRNISGDHCQEKSICGACVIPMVNLERF